MGMRRLALAVVLLAVWPAVSVPAQPTGDELTLDDCIELALKNRAAIIAAQGRERLAAAGKRSALGAFLPRLQAQFDYSQAKRTDIKAQLEGFPETTSPDQDLSNKALSVSAQMWGFNAPVWFDYFAARARQAGAELDVIASEQDLILAVKTAFYAYLAAAQNVAVQEEAVRRAEEQLKLVQSRYELGSASRSEVLKQKVRYGEDQLSLLRARNSLTASQARLAYTIGLDPRQEWRFSTDYVVREFSGSLDEAIEFGLTHQPTLLSMEHSLRASAHDVRSAYASYLPTVGLFASYRLSEGTSGDTLTFDFSSKTGTIGLQVSWTIFDGFSREQRIVQAKVGRNDARAQLADQRNLTISNIKTYYLDIVQLKEQKKVSDENVAAAEEDLRITQERYRLGAASILDLLDAQVSLKQAQVAAIQVDFDLNLKIAQLEQAMGKM